MSSGRTTIRQLLAEQPAGAPTGRRLAKPAAMTVLAFALGAALLGLAGWFIASSAVAGLAVASTFSFLFPSAGVQALAWARTLGRYGERISTHRATLDLVGSLRTSLFARALRLPRDRVAELRSSELLGRITVDSDAVENLLLRSSFPILAAIAALVGTAALFAWLSATLAIVAVAGLAVCGAILIGLAHHQAGRPASRLVAARADARHTLIETLDGLPELRSFGAEQRAAAGVARHLEQLAENRRQLTTLAARGQSVGTLLADLTLLAVVATASGLLGTGTLPAPTFVAVCLVAIAAFEPIIGLPAAIAALARARAAAARLTDVFPHGTSLAASTGVVDTWPATIEIRLEDQRIDVALAAGATVLLTGASGTGKSTVLRAISGHPAPASTLSSPASTRPASTPKRSPSASRWSPRTPTSSTARSATTSSSPIPRQLNPSSGRHSPPPRSTIPSPRSQPGSTLRSARAEKPSRAANAAASASRRECSGAPTYCCSTSPPKALTPRPPRACSPASERSTRAPRS